MARDTNAGPGGLNFPAVAGRGEVVRGIYRAQAADLPKRPTREMPKRPPKLLITASFIAECRPGIKCCKSSIDPASSVRPRATTSQDTRDR